MIPSTVIVPAVVAFAIVAFFGVQVYLRLFRPGESLGPQANELTPVDLEAFENLTDPDEEEFLRSNLSSSEFRHVQRLRIRAAKLYVKVLLQNANVLVAIGEGARLNSNPELAAMGQELVQKAHNLKLWCAVSLARMQGALLFPVLLSPTNRLANQYMVVSYMAASLPGRAAA
ncbi:MAG TPA: hypothetical protein VMI10_25705 [Terriglobales bacterium]|nr:hypothetical protein [Terriglobales bacterium]